MSFLLIFNIFSHLHFIVYTVEFEQVCKWGAATPTDSLIVNYEHIQWNNNNRILNEMS